MVILVSSHSVKRNIQPFFIPGANGKKLLIRHPDSCKLKGCGAVREIPLWGLLVPLVRRRENE
jgi:hypothetical protein